VGYQRVKGYRQRERSTQTILAVEVWKERAETNLEPRTTNRRRMSVTDGFPSASLTLVMVGLTRCSVAGCAGTAFVHDCGRPMNTKLLHPVDQ
jgi:hypothetical protein